MHATTAPHTLLPRHASNAHDSHESQPPRNAGDAAPHAVDSQSLLQGNKTVAIHHNGAWYRLQATKLGKLILTK